MPDLPDQVRTKVSELMSERTQAARDATQGARDRAQKAARTLLEQAGLDHVADNATDRVTHLLEDILTASRTNRRVLEKLVEDQIDEAAARLGFARQLEVDALRKEIADLRVQVVQTPARRAASRKATGTRKGHSTAAAPMTKKSTTKRTPAQAATSTANKAATKKAPAKKAAKKTASS